MCLRIARRHKLSLFWRRHLVILLCIYIYHEYNREYDMKFSIRMRDIWEYDDNKCMQSSVGIT